jgi:ATP/ADP translocase/CRP-like cAMP-binding protein
MAIFRNGLWAAGSAVGTRLTLPLVGAAIGLRDWRASLTDIRREERAPTLLMGAYGFLALTSYYVLKPVRNSVFLERVGAENLPYIYILTAAAVTLLMVVYSRHVHRIGERTLLLGTFAFLALNLVGFWWWLGMAGETFAASSAFYVWGKIYPLLLVSQFYLVGNLLFTTRQARRLFGFIGIGLILGGVAGSAISGWAVSRVGTEALLLVAAALLVPCAAIVGTLAPRLRSGRPGSARLVDELSGDALQLLRGSTHLRTITWILGLTIVASTLIDWQFNSLAERMIPGEDAKTAFFGRFFLGLNLASVSIQILVTGVVLRTLGIGSAMLFLPLVLLVATAGILTVPVLLTAVLAKGAEGSLRYSLDQSTRELLYLPVPAEVKRKVKPLIDLAVYRGGTGLAGLLLVLVVNVLNLPWGVTVRLVAGLTAICVALWIAMTFRMRSEFRRSVRHLIDVRDVELDDLVGTRLDAETWEEVRRALDQGKEEQVLFALGLLERYPRRELTSEVARLLDHGSTDVRRRAAALLRKISARDSGDVIQSELRRALTDSRMDPWTRERIPALLATGATPATVNGLLQALPNLEAALRHEVLKALGRLHRSHPELSFTGYDIEPELAREVREAYRWAAYERALAAATTKGHPAAMRLLAVTLHQRRREAAERASRILGLHYSAEDLYVAFTALQSADPLVRQNGIELLDSTLKRRHRESLGPLLDPERDLAAIAGLAAEHYGFDPGPGSEALRALASDGSDGWVACLAAATLGAPPPLEAGCTLTTASRQAPGSAPRQRQDGASVTRPSGTATNQASRRLEIMDIIERAELLGRTYLLEKLRTEDLAEIAALATERHCASGEVLFEEGLTSATELYVVAEGAITAKNRSGRALFTAQTFGDLTFLYGLPQAYRAVAESDSRVLVLARDDFQEFLRERFTVVEAVLARLAGAIRMLDRRLGDPEPAREPPESPIALDRSGRP